MQLNHLLILAQDLPAVRRFFVDAIGLEDGPRPPFPFPGAWLYSEGRPLIHLAAADNDPRRSAYLGERNAGGGAIDHLALTGADFDALIARLDRLGIEYAKRAVPLEGHVQIFVPGPEGLKVEMLFPLNTSSSAQSERLSHV